MAFHFYTKLFASILCVVLFILDAYCADKLQFWEPGLWSDNNRRVNKRLRNKTQVTVKLQDRSNHTQKDKIQLRTDDPKKDIDQKKNQKKAVKDVLRKLPKKKQMRFRNSPDSTEIKSTRMTPMYLMQQPQEKPKQKNNEGNEDNEDAHLNAYAISQQMDKLLSKFPDANVTKEILGRTVEYNDILLLKIALNKNDEGKYFRADDSKFIDEVPEKKIVFIVHGLSVMGIHNAMALKIERYLTMLLSYYFAHLDKFDIFLIPLANPDGYNFAATTQYWNKNVSPQAACGGVALDRNFDVAWNSTKLVSSCSQRYPGSTPFSEPETRAVRDVFHRYSHKIIAYFNVHPGVYSKETFKGEAVLYPRGYTEAQTDDDKYIDLKGEIDEAMKNASFKVMSVAVDTLYNWYGKVSGSSVDYASAVYGIPYAIELVMQLYSTVFERYNNYLIDKKDEIEEYVLTEIWGRVLNVIFNNIYKSTMVNEV